MKYQKFLLKSIIKMQNIYYQNKRQKNRANVQSIFINNNRQTFQNVLCLPKNKNE